MFNVPSFFGFRSNSGVSFDADYQAILDYATTQGYTLPSASQRILQNQLMIDLKAAGIWSKLGTFVMMANDSTDYRFAFIDWKRLVDYSPISSIDSTYVQNRGFYGDGISMGIDTNFNLSTNTSVYAQNDAHKMIWEYEDSVNYPKNANAMDGVVGRSGYNSSKMTNSNQHRLNSSTNYTGNNTIGNKYGFYSLSRNTSSTFNSYTRNSADISMVVENATSASISLINDDASIFLGQTSFGVGQFMATAYSLGLYLDATEIDNYYSALNTYISTL
jgi:hypothetical protein